MAVAGNEQVRVTAALAPRFPRGGTHDRELARAFFDVNTCGLLLIDRTGTVLAANASVRGMIDVEIEEDATRCCDVFGCGDPAGPLDGECLTTYTLANGRLRDLPLRLSAGGAGRPAVVTTAALDGGYVLLELQARDGRSGPRSRVPLPGKLSVFMLGRMRLEDEGGSIGQDWLEHLPGQLLKLLITERRRVVSVDEIADALWSNAGPPGRRNVRQCVYAIRSRLDPGRTAPSLVIAHRGGYSIDRRRLHVDCDEFESHVLRGMEAFRAGHSDVARRRLSMGLELYRGEYLADEPYAHWALQERTRLVGIASEGLRALALLAARHHDYDGATHHLEQLAGIDRYDMDVQRGLIALCMARGRRSEARRRYMTLRSRLREEFGEDPGFDLADPCLQTHPLAVLPAV